MGEARELPVLTDDVIDLAAWVGGDPLWRAIAEIAAASWWCAVSAGS